MKTKFELINSLKNEIDILLPATEWSAEFTDQIKIDFTFQSNKIENNSISYGQTISFLKDATTPKGVSIKDCVDIQNHFDILDAIFKIYREEISEAFILNLHSNLMKDEIQWADKDSYSPGKYKWATNYTIREGEKIHWYMEYTKVPEAILDLLNKINLQLKTSDITDIQKHPLTIATFFHNRFLGEIHPFADGNGRVCRIIMNDILIKKGFSPIFIKDTDKINYFKFFETSSSTDLDAMLTFFADQLIDSLKSKKMFVLKFLAQKKLD